MASVLKFLHPDLEKSREGSDALAASVNSQIRQLRGRSVCIHLPSSEGWQLVSALRVSRMCFRILAGFAKGWMFAAIGSEDYLNS